MNNHVLSAVAVIASIASCTPASRSVKVTLVTVLSEPRGASPASGERQDVEDHKGRVIRGPWDVRLEMRRLQNVRLFEVRGIPPYTWGDPRAPGGVVVTPGQKVFFKTCDSPHARRSEFVAWLNANKIVVDCSLDELLGGDTHAPLRSVAHVQLAKVSDSALTRVVELRSLRSLYLPQTVSDAGMDHLKGLTALHTLDLAGTQVSDAGLEHLKGLTALQTLDLSDTKVSDAGLEHLKGLTALQTLDLFGTEVSDAGLEHLRGLTALQTLDLRHTKVSTTAEARLRAQGIIVVW